MRYKDATHSKRCNAKTVPMNCRYCGQEVFYFTCNCGSKVFFEELGDPWPIHDCSKDCQVVGFQMILPKGYLLDGQPKEAITLGFMDIQGDTLLHGYAIKVKKI